MGEDEGENKKDGGSEKGKKNEKEVLAVIRKQYSRKNEMEGDYEENIDEVHDEKMDK